MQEYGKYYNKSGKQYSGEYYLEEDRVRNKLIWGS